MKPLVKLSIIIVASIALLAALFFLFDFWKYRPRTILCDDGDRQFIDYRDMRIKYSSTRITLDEEVIDVLKLRQDINPQVLQLAVESTQGWDQFLKGLIAGFNSCGVNKAEYALILQRYKGMEDISKNLSYLLQKRTLSQQDMDAVTQLINQYSSLSQDMFSQAYEDKR